MGPFGRTVAAHGALPGGPPVSPALRIGGRRRGICSEEVERAGEDGEVPEPLEPALARLRPLLADPECLVRAVGAGRRRGAHPTLVRAQVRSVQLKAGLRLQVTTTDGGTPPSIRTANH